MKKLLAKYLQSVCSPDEFQEITKWMSRMDNDFTLSLFMKPHWEHMIQQEPNYPVNYALWEKIKLAMEEKEKAETLRRLKLYTWGIRVAAVLILGLLVHNVRKIDTLIDVAAVLILGLLVSNIFFMQNAKQPGTFVQTQSISVPHGARTSFTLPDSSVVWLNSGSTLSYSSEYTDNRSLELEGEAYFEVVKSENPFTVTTATVYFDGLQNEDQVVIEKQKVDSKSILEFELPERGGFAVKIDKR